MALNSNALVTLSFAKKWLKIPDLETTLDDMVELFVNASSQHIEDYCNRKFALQSHVEYHHGRSSNMILLDQFPVISITELRIDPNSVFTDSNTLKDATTYALGDFKNTLILTDGSIFPKGYHNIRATYTAGFAAIPSNLQMACLWFCTWYHRMREGQNIGRSNKSKDGESAQWAQEAPPYIMAVLNNYKKSEVPSLDSPVWNG
ncbi:MAG: hypothetical protein RLZZ74_3440 [Cyanobacteriota bacterium]|jgi:hypothetical protein